MSFFRFLLPVTLAAGIISCNTYYRPATVQYLDYRIDSTRRADTSLSLLLAPYRDSLDRIMNDVVAVSSVTLDKRQPESTLGNALVDAMLTVGRQRYTPRIEAAILNYGGIRLTTLAKGDITRGKIFELAPFDNIIVVLSIPGTILQQWLDHIALHGGWPCAGISFRIRENRATGVMINGKPLDSNMVYQVATLDYVANGGDDCTMLKPVLRENNGYLFREAVLDYFSGMNKAGQPVAAKIENRVTYAN